MYRVLLCNTGLDIKLWTLSVQSERLFWKLELSHNLPQWSVTLNVFITTYMFSYVGQPKYITFQL